MVILELAGRPDGSATLFDGQFLKEFDFEASEGRGSITLTQKEAEAKKFRDNSEAWAYLRLSPNCKPIREDGQPNRPLTSTNWVIRPLREL